MQNAQSTAPSIKYIMRAQRDEAKASKQPPATFKIYDKNARK